MKSQLRQFFFGTSIGDNKVMNIGWLLFRLHIGLSLAIHAGLPKMKDIAAPGWFNDQVAGLGFTFPSPAFWATVASWGEFVGGICIALGILTRFSAIQLAFQFFVISFLWYEKPEPLTGMYFQQTLFWGYVLIAFAGGGRYSLDKLIMNRKKIPVNLAVKTSVATLLLLVTINCSAQKGPLKGSGKIINITFEYKDFTKIELQDLDGKVEIEMGKPFSITVAIDDNLESLLDVAEKNQELKIELKGNTNNKLYIEETGISIKITLPEIYFLKHRGNGNVYVNEIAGKSLQVKNSGNGNIFLNGSIGELDIICSGNGTVNAEKLFAKSVTTKRSGNGNVIINTDNNFTATNSGNGNVINKGNGIAGTNSSANGNSSIIDANHKPKENPYSTQENDTKVIRRIKNNTDSRVELKVVYPVKGSYGITIKPGQTHQEYFPLGTKIYKQGKMKELLFEITVENRENVLLVNE
jgi:uncharacterized membrane protein YphA (DoxX/SURF4 family)